MCPVSMDIQKNFNGLNTFGTMKICYRQGLFELISVDNNATSGGKIGISFRFCLNDSILYVLIRIASSRRF